MNKDEILVRIQKLPVRVPKLIDKYPVVFWVVLVAGLLVGFAVGKAL